MNEKPNHGIDRSMCASIQLSSYTYHLRPVVQEVDSKMLDLIGDDDIPIISREFAEKRLSHILNGAKQRASEHALTDAKFEDPTITLFAHKGRQTSAFFNNGEKKEIFISYLYILTQDTEHEEELEDTVYEFFSDDGSINFIGTEEEYYNSMGREEIDHYIHSLSNAITGDNSGKSQIEHDSDPAEMSALKDAINYYELNPPKDVRTLTVLRGRLQAAEQFIASKGRES